MRYDNILIDAVNLAYQTFKTKKEVPSAVGAHNVYKYSVRCFLQTVKELERKWLAPNGQIYILYDNYTSRAEMAQMFSFVNRKELSESYKSNRTKQPQEFYNSLNLTRYYYLHEEPQYHTGRISELEADDLIKPLLRTACKEGTVLLVSTDLDWARAIGERVDWLNDIHGEPVHHHELSAKLGFDVTEASLIAYKSLFGDDSDCVKAITRRTEEHYEEFRKVAPMLKDADDLVSIARKAEGEPKNSIFKDIRKSEWEYRVNCQLVGYIEVADGHIKEVITTGRDVPKMCKAINDALMANNEKSFSFGVVKRPRGESKVDEIKEE